MDNNQTGLTKQPANTSKLQTTSSKGELQQWNALQTSAGWIRLKEAGQFEQKKAFSSLLALPENLDRVRPATIEQAISDIYPTIATVRKYHGKEAGKDSVIEIVGQSAALVNVGKNLKPHQIDFLADEIMGAWYWLTIGEIRFVMEQGVKGKYGELYDRIDVNAVLSWFEKYDETRTEITEAKVGRSYADECAYWKEEGKKNEALKTMPKTVADSLQKLENTFLVDGESKRGIVQGEFEPDEPTLRMIEMEWADLPEVGRVPYENYKALRIAHLKTQMKK